MSGAAIAYWADVLDVLKFSAVFIGMLGMTISLIGLIIVITDVSPARPMRAVKVAIAASAAALLLALFIPTHDVFIQLMSANDAQCGAK